MLLVLLLSLPFAVTAIITTLIIITTVFVTVSLIVVVFWLLLSLMPEVRSPGRKNRAGLASHLRHQRV